MAEEKTTAGGVEITVGEKTVGRKAAEATPFVGGVLKSIEAQGKFSDGRDSSETMALASEGTAVLASIGTSALGIATDPIGWLVGQGLNFLIAVVQPLEDAVHFVSGDGPALSQASENFNNIAKGVAELRKTFDSDLSNSVQNWGGQTADVAATRLGEFANGIDGVAGQAGELASMLATSSMIMQIIEDVIKAILTELITWLIMIWIPALAAAAPSFGASTATAGAVTSVRVASTASRVTRIIARLKQFLSKIMQFLRSLGGRIKNVRSAFQKSMADKQVSSHFADIAKDLGSKSPVVKLMSKDGMIGERVQKGFLGSMGKATVDAGRSQLGVGSGANAGIDKPLRNMANYQKSDEYDDTGKDHSHQRIEGYLDI